MPLPDAGTTWPPPAAADHLAVIAEHDAWYSGKPDRIHGYYAGAVDRPRVRPSQYRGDWQDTGDTWNDMGSETWVDVQQTGF